MTWSDVYEAAGIVGIDPGPLTVRELFWMLYGRQHAEWGQTSQICATIFNATPRGKKNKNKVFKASEFSPYKSASDDIRISFKDALGLLSGKKVMVGNHGKERI